VPRHDRKHRGRHRERSGNRRLYSVRSRAGDRRLTVIKRRPTPLTAARPSAAVGSHRGA
jgi:hypothetical protein